MKALFPLLERAGVHVTPVHFYEPVPDTRTLPATTWTSRSSLPGIDMNPAGQLDLLETLTRHREEFSGTPVGPSGPGVYHVMNGSFEGGDGDALFAMLRHLRPRRMVEVGSGFSTFLAARALRANESDGRSAELVVVDPFPDPVVAAGLPGVSRVIRAPVQDAPMEVFTSLQDGDVLFIDSSHVLAIGSDVRHEFLEILPRLAEGVVVHVHDVFLPRDYPRELVLEKHFFWTEQYLLQAFLAFNGAFEVLLALAWLHLEHPDRLEAAFPHFRRERFLPGSFWMRRTGSGSSG